MTRQLSKTVSTALFTIVLAASTYGQHQTNTFSPAIIDGDLPYSISLSTYDMGAMDIPTLHSYAVGKHDGKWVMLAGRTNGLHGFLNSGPQNFPVEFQNRDVWVIDPAARQSWSRSLEDVTAGLSADDVAALTPTNNQFMQSGDRLYMTGGYGANAFAGFDTHNALSAIDLPGIIDWVVNGTGQAADHIRMVRDDLFRVTGGAMYEMEGRAHLVFGQSFRGGYVPNRDGDYTKQVRSFAIVDDGTTLEFDDVTQTTPLPEYRRRDLNVFPSMQRNMDGSLSEGLTVLSGVFTETFGAWTVPVEIDSAGNPTMADPTSPEAFKQGVNGYHSAKLGLFSEATDKMHEILFGGITVLEYDFDSQQLVCDDNLPWTNQIASIVRDKDGHYEQHLIGEFPEILDQDDNRLRFGANAEFFLSPGIETYDNGVVNLDALTETTVLGYIHGGIFANAPHVRGVPDAVSGASNTVFEVTYTPVPEPSSMLLLALAWAVLSTFNRREMMATK